MQLFLKTRRSLAVLAGLLLFFIPTAVAQQSTNYSIDRITVTAASQKVSSSSYESTVVAEHGSPSGAASFCNGGFVASLGFFSVLGDLTVPIHLYVDKNAIDPSVIELSWTGAAALFQVYRASTPQNLVDPANLDTQTTQCDASDDQNGSNLVFYTVIAG